MGTKKSPVVLILSSISLFAAAVGYGFVGISFSFELMFVIVLLGVISGFGAMKLCRCFFAKVMTGIPTALNSIVFLYLCSPFIFATIEVFENA